MPTQVPHRHNGRGRSPALATAGQLEVGEKITVDIVARRYWNDTGLYVTAGQCYQFTARGTWIDFYIPCAADGYPTPGWLLQGPLGRLTRMVLRLRRVPEGNWFVLVGAVRAAGHYQHFVCGSSREAHVPTSGQPSAPHRAG